MNNSLARADALYEQGRHQQSAEEARRNISADPENARGHARLAAALAELHRFSE